MTAGVSHVRPLVDPAGIDDGLPLAGGPLRFGRAVLTGRDGGRRVVPAAALAEVIGPAALGRLTAPRPPLPGLAGPGPHVMGILNVTPDSFSDGGIDRDAAAAVARGLAMAAAGADIVDVGGESTRPGAAAVTPDEELARVLPVVRELCAAGVAVSIDSRHARVQAAAVAAGACLINDVSGLAHDPDSLRVAAASGRPVAVMHMRGTPATMQGLAHYRDVAAEVHDELAARLDACAAAGLAPERIVLDPGLGFAKTARHNVALLRDLAVLHGLGCRLLVGASRKSFIARLSRDEPPDRRLAGSLAAALAALDAGAQMLRVHDVAETVQAVALWRALRVPTDATAAGP